MTNPKTTAPSEATAKRAATRTRAAVRQPVLRLVADGNVKLLEDEWLPEGPVSKRGPVKRTKQTPLQVCQEALDSKQYEADELASLYNNTLEAQVVRLRDDNREMRGTIKELSTQLRKLTDIVSKLEKDMFEPH